MSNLTWFSVGILSVLLLMVLPLILQSASAVFSAISTKKAGSGTTQSYGISILAVVTIVVGYTLLTAGKAQTLTLLVALVVATYAFKRFLKSPPLSWGMSAAVAVALLFLSWDPTWSYVEKLKDLYTAQTPAKTPAQLQARIPKVRDDFLRVGTDQVTVQIAYPVNVYGPPGHTMCVMPENTFSYDTSAARRGYITVIPPQVGTWIPVTLWWQKNPQC